MPLAADAPCERFALEGRAGGGGMGDVYKGLDRTTGAAVALKLLRSTATPHERARFRREVAMLAELRHPNIVQYLAHGTWSDGRPYLAMEWLDGEDLGQRQRRAPLGMREAVEVVRRSAAAMAAVHARGVVHRDLKLSNLFLVKGKGTSVKLIDFGVVKLPEPDEHPTERGAIIGTPHFMAPEQARGEPIDARADVYSLGAVLFRLVTGRNVFDTEHVVALLGRLVVEDPPRPSSLRFDVPPALDEVIWRSLARARDARFDNGAELARALARVGEIPNDPPATDQSSSSVRRTGPRAADAGASDAGQARQSSAERRVVACLLFELPADDLLDETTHDSREGRRLPPVLDDVLPSVLGPDARIEGLVGHKFVAILGMDRSVGDEVERAARGALAVVEAASHARVAVAIGHAVRGRANVTGQALERAAEAIERAGRGEVRLDGHAAAALEGRFVVQLDAAALTTGSLPRGLRGGKLLHEEDTSTGARMLLGRATPTVGRDKELALLQGVYSEMLDDSSPRAAVVSGAPGIGKSRVRAELVQRFEASPASPEVLVCRGELMTRGSSVPCLGRALRTMFGVRDGEFPERQIAKVRAYVGGYLPKSLRFLSAFLGELAGVPFPDAGDEPLRAARASGELMKSRLRMALEAFVRAKSERAPQVFLLEDMQWADDASIDLVDWLLGCAQLRFAAFGFARPELGSRVPTLWDGRTLTRLTLGPLSVQASERLVAAALPGIDPSTRADVVRRAGGNALFLEELVRCAAEGHDELPLTVQALVQLRLDRMSAGAKEVLRCASVFGHSFWRGAIESMLSRPIDVELVELQQAEIVAREPQCRIAGQEEWGFRQLLVRDAAYASIVDDDRAALHLAVGAWIEQAGDADVGLVAHHVEAGGDRARAAALYGRATKQALAHGALEAALDLARRGLSCGAAGELRAELLVEQAQLCASMGRLDESVPSADEGGTLSERGTDLWGAAQRVLGASLIELGRSSDGEARLSWALRPDVGAGLSSASRSSLLASRVRGLIDLGRLPEALDASSAAVRLAESSDASTLVRALDARVFALLHASDPSGVLESGSRLVSAADKAGDVWNGTRARINVASSLNAVGAYEEARTMLEHALLDARARRMRILEAFCLHNLGMSHARLGSLDEGIDHQRGAALVADETNAARLRVHTRTYEAMFLTLRGNPGDYAAARDLAQSCASLTRSIPSLAHIPSFLMARVHLLKRSPAEALPSAEAAHAQLALGPVEEWEEYIRLTYVQVLDALGRTGQAAAAIGAAFDALVAKALRIQQRRYRASFLTRHDEVRALIELAQARVSRVLPPM